MKYLVNLTFLLFILVSCNQNAPDTSAFDDGLALFEKNKAIADKTFNLFIAKDIDGVMNLFADSALWSPPEYNSYEWLSKDELKVALTNYMNAFDNLKFTPGINLPGGNLVDGFWGGSRYRSDGNENTSSLSSSNPNNIRVYGTWSSTHTESGKETFSKWYAIVNFNDIGKIVRFNDWFNVDGLQVQINQ